MGATRRVENPINHRQGINTSGDVESISERQQRS